MGKMANHRAVSRTLIRSQLAVAAILLVMSGAAAADQTPAQAMQAGPGGKTANLLWLKPSDAKACPTGMAPVTNAQGAVATENGKTKCVPATNNMDHQH